MDRIFLILKSNLIGLTFMVFVFISLLTLNSCKIFKSNKGDPVKTDPIPSKKEIPVMYGTPSAKYKIID